MQTVICIDGGEVLKSIIHSSGNPATGVNTWYPIFASGFGPKSYVGVSHVKIKIPCRIQITEAGIASPFSIIRVIVNGSNNMLDQYSNQLPGDIGTGYVFIELIEIDISVINGTILMTASVQMSSGYLTNVNTNRFVARGTMAGIDINTADVSIKSATFTSGMQILWSNATMEIH